MLDLSNVSRNKKGLFEQRFGAEGPLILFQLWEHFPHIKIHAVLVFGGINQWVKCLTEIKNLLTGVFQPRQQQLMKHHFLYSAVSPNLY